MLFQPAGIEGSNRKSQDSWMKILLLVILDQFKIILIKYDRKSIFILYVPELGRIRYQLLIKPTLTKSNLAILLSIATIGVFLSVISYQYSTITANDISRIASMDVRSNAKIEA